MTQQVHRYDPHLMRAVVEKMRGGMNSAAVERTYGISPSVALDWRRRIEEADHENQGTDEGKEQ